MIESGTHVPGVSADDFGLPSNMALRIELPDERLRACILDYHVMDSQGPADWTVVDWMLPSWPAIRFALTEKTVSITFGDQRYDPLPVASLYGTISRAMRVSSHGGATIGVSINPIGWRRLFAAPAEQFRDRIVPLEEVWPKARVADLVEQLSASDRGPSVKGILDAFFLDLARPPHRDEVVVRQIMALILEDTTSDLNAAAEAIGISSAKLRRLSRRYFGFAPKTLLNRLRFLRSFVQMLERGEDADYSVIASSYHDTSHFLRDAQQFLGMTPRRFLAMETPYLRIFLRARSLVLAAQQSGRS